MATVPIAASDDNIVDALRQLQDLGENGIGQMRQTMSVLIYRLSKVLCNPAQLGGSSWVDRVRGAISPAGSSPVGLLRADIAAHGISTANFPKLETCLTILETCIRCGVLYQKDRVMAGVGIRPPAEDLDDMYQRQDRTDPQYRKEYTSWSRPLPFRPLYCMLSAFATAFPVLQNAKTYDDVPAEDSILYQGGDDKPKVREDTQRSFATLLDAIDYAIGFWKGFVKCEPSFDEFTATPLMMPPNQRPLRKGHCYWRKSKGSISPDLVIVSRHDQLPTRDNITHVVDMKFGEDSLREEQGNRYIKALGPKLLVLYFPKDCTVSEDPKGQIHSEWIKVLLTVLALLLARGRGGAGSGGLRPVHVPV
ncbi:hypothetical protein os1_23190 [Comamonadaceae bacterium OS-1]|nr:hypothetical protein os1_23190 [Comamonadaceae bacterium OS-1]